MDEYIVLVENLIVFGFNRSCFFISTTADGNVYVGTEIIHKSLFGL